MNFSIITRQSLYQAEISDTKSSSPTCDPYKRKIEEVLTDLKEPQDSSSVKKKNRKWTFDRENQQTIQWDKRLKNYFHHYNRFDTLFRKEPQDFIDIDLEKEEMKGEILEKISLAREIENKNSNSHRFENDIHTKDTPNSLYLDNETSFISDLNLLTDDQKTSFASLVITQDLNSAFEDLNFDSISNSSFTDETLFSDGETSFSDEETFFLDEETSFISDLNLLTDDQKTSFKNLFITQDLDFAFENLNFNSISNSIAAEDLDIAVLKHVFSLVNEEEYLAFYHYIKKKLEETSFKDFAFYDFFINTIINQIKTQYPLLTEEEYPSIKTIALCLVLKLGDDNNNSQYSALVDYFRFSLKDSLNIEELHVLYLEKNRFLRCFNIMEGYLLKMIDYRLPIMYENFSQKEEKPFNLKPFNKT